MRKYPTAATSVVNFYQSNAENLKKLSEREIELGTVGTKNSWHNIYKESAWIFVGGLPFDLTEGDVICIFSQYGEIVNINMVRDKKTGKTKGFAFICYEDQRSTILAVDNINTAKILQRTVRVDHVKDYKPPDQDDKNVDDITKIVRAEGVAPRVLTSSGDDEDDLLLPVDGKEKKKKKKEKKIKKGKKVKKERLELDERNKWIKEEPESPSHCRRDQNKSTSHGEDYRRDRQSRPSDVKQEKNDPSYNKYANHLNRDSSRNERHDINTFNGKRNGEESSSDSVPTKEEKDDRGKNLMVRLPDRRRRDSPARRSADRQRGGSPDRQRDRSHDRQRDSTSGRQRDRSHDRQRVRSPDRQRNRTSDRQRDRSPHRRRDRSSDQQRDRSAAVVDTTSKSRHTPDRDGRSEGMRGQESSSRKSPFGRDRKRSRSPYDQHRKRSRSKERQRYSRSPRCHRK